MAYVRHGTLVAGQQTVVQLPVQKWDLIEVLNVTGSDTIYFLVLANRDNATSATVAGDNCEVLPATVCALGVSAPDGDPIRVKLISAGSVGFSVRAE